MEIVKRIANSVIEGKIAHVENLTKEAVEQKENVQKILNEGFAFGLDTVGEKFTAGFGVDSQIQISREFKDKKVDTLWGNRVEKYDYRIAIDNYKNSSVRLRLLERIPYTEDEELKIEGFTTNKSLSKDTEYLRTEREKGLLRWDLDLEPATTEQKATIVTYGYTMKYDNDMHIQSVPVHR